MHCYSIFLNGNFLMVYDRQLKTDLNEKLKQIDDYWFWNFEI